MHFSSAENLKNWYGVGVTLLNHIPFLVVIIAIELGYIYLNAFFFLSNRLIISFEPFSMKLLGTLEIATSNKITFKLNYK